jgi:hypothetical protein
MGYPHDLLHASWTISRSVPEDEALFRRAVSTAWYALFHLLIGDACANWANTAQRNKLGRQFDHRRMKEASAFTAKYTVSQIRARNVGWPIVAAAALSGGLARAEIRLRTYEIAY